jgi:hypothetical protein
LKYETSIAAGYNGKRRECMRVAASLRRKRQTKVCLPTASRCRLGASLFFSAALFFLAGILSANPAHAQSVTKSPAALRTLTKANEVHSLSTEESKRAYPVHLRAVVTYFDPSYGTETASMFVHDSSGGVYVSLRANRPENITPGSLIDVTGVSGSGGFAPIVDQAQVKVIGHAPLPSNPHRVSLLRMHSGIEDCQGSRLKA